MQELIDIAFSPVNITLTLLMLLLIVYWLFTMISGIDFDLDIDVDIDMEADIDTDSSIEGGNLDFDDVANAEINKEDIVGKRRKPLKWWQIILIYFNFVGLPFMFTFTCWIFIWWMMTLVSTTLAYSFDNSFGYIIMLIAIFPSLIVTKLFTTPFKNFFKNLNKDGDAPIDLIGRTGTMQSNISENKMGSAEVVAESVPMTIYVKSLKGEPIKYNETILIINQSTDKNYYYVKSYN